MEEKYSLCGFSVCSFYKYIEAMTIITDKKCVALSRDKCNNSTSIRLVEGWSK